MPGGADTVVPDTRHNFIQTNSLARAPAKSYICDIWTLEVVPKICIRVRPPRRELDGSVPRFSIYRVHTISNAYSNKAYREGARGAGTLLVSPCILMRIYGCIMHAHPSDESKISLRTSSLFWTRARNQSVVRHYNNVWHVINIITIITRAFLHFAN